MPGNCLKKSGPGDPFASRKRRSRQVVLEVLRMSVDQSERVRKPSRRRKAVASSK